jgi:hypothetical protein
MNASETSSRCRFRALLFYDGRSPSPGSGLKEGWVVTDGQEADDVAAVIPPQLLRRGTRSGCCSICWVWVGLTFARALDENGRDEKQKQRLLQLLWNEGRKGGGSCCPSLALLHRWPGLVWKLMRTEKQKQAGAHCFRLLLG